MKNYLFNVEKVLRNATELYNQIIISRNFDDKNWKENVKLFSPIIDKLQRHIAIRMDVCQYQIEEKRKTQNEQIISRIELYDRFSKEKNHMSDLDLARIKIGTEIRDYMQEIEDINIVIANLQQKILEAKTDKEYWDTVFWATCWIPLVNIGTGIKKESEEGKYRAQVKVGKESCERKRSRIEELANQLRGIETRQKQIGESSGMLANQITATEGQIFEVTNTLNALNEEISLWHSILTTCSEINVELQHTNGKIERVQECFYKLTKVSDLLVAPSTDKFIRGCVCKGNMLSVGEKLNQNEYLLSKNRCFVLVMQADNNLVLYTSEKAIWDTKTWGTQGKGYVELDADGLVALKETNKSWNTKRAGATTLILQDNGDLVTYDKDGKPLWGSDTYIYAIVPNICFRRL